MYKRQRNENVADAQQRCNVGMTARLDQNALARVNQHHSRIGCRCAGGHVARVLLVARRVRNDEFTARGGKVAVSNIDGDALFALRAQAVSEQCKINLSGRGGSFALDGADLIFVN